MAVIYGDLIYQSLVVQRRATMYQTLSSTKDPDVSVMDLSYFWPRRSPRCGGVARRSSAHLMARTAEGKADGGIQKGHDWHVPLIPFL
jgi:hypothetical protein